MTALCEEQAEVKVIIYKNILLWKPWLTAVVSLIWCKKWCLDVIWYTFINSLSAPQIKENKSVTLNNVRIIDHIK